MSAYLVFNYAITDAEGYGAYPGAAFGTMSGRRGVTVLCDEFVMPS